MTDVAKIQPVVFYVPTSASLPVEVKVAHSGLRMVLVNRESIAYLDDWWKVLGVYFLLGPAESASRYSAYVGEVGRRDLLMRLKEHATQKEWWSRALLIASASGEFNSAEIGWLEGRLYDVLKNAVAADVMNKGRPGDDSIGAWDRGVLEKYVEPITAALRACGAPPDTPDQAPVPGGRRRTVYRESVKDLLEAGLLKPGTHLHPLRESLSTTASVLDDGRLQIVSESFNSVSAAAQHVSGNKSEPGWEFWGSPSGDGGLVSLFDLRTRLRELSSDASAAATQTHAPLSGAAEAATPKGRRQFKSTLHDLVQAQLVAPGETLIPTREKHSQTAIVLDDGRLDVNGQSYGSLSAAAQAVSGNKAEPGWEFWAVQRPDGRIPLFDLRAVLEPDPS